ncbi:MAG: alpha-glucosidase, partial [Myxococcota bacterium]
HNWNSDEETIAHMRRFARIHLALEPEWTALATEAEERSTPMIRGLFMHYPEDPEVRGVSDQYLIGTDLLVAPVVEEGAVDREVVLPEGSWFHVWTGVSWEGPARVVVEAPIGMPPVFSRGGDRADLRAIE